MKMKKLLILAYDFPPYVSVGALRPYAWYKYLHEFGVYPIVVTRQWGNQYGNQLDYIAAGETNEIIIEESERGVIIRTPYKPNLANRLMLKYGPDRYRFLRKLISAYYEFFQWFFWIGPKVGLYFAAHQYLKNHKVDVIIATGDPFILFRYASVLSKRHSTPWIADYRDPWVQKSHNFFEAILSNWNSRLERRYVKSAYCVSTVSDFFKAKILSNVGKIDSHILTNGYDGDNINILADRKQESNILTVSFVGMIYRWHPLEIFLDCVEEFVLGGYQIILKFYGINMDSELQKLIEYKYSKIKDNIKIINKLPNLSLLSELKKDNILLLFNYYSIIGTKIFDYVALKRKILFCFTEDVGANELKKKYYHVHDTGSFIGNPQQDIILQTQSGILVRNSKHLLEVLKDLYHEFAEKGFIECNSVNTEQFSRKIQTKKLAEIIKSFKPHGSKNSNH